MKSTVDTILTDDEISGSSSTRISNKIRKQNKWSRKEDEELMKLANENKGRNWKFISMFFDKNPIQCYSRYNRIKEGIKRGLWQEEEDNKLLQLVKKLGKQWALIARELKTRTGKQVRDRYINYLDPKLRLNEDFTPLEDEFIIKSLKEYGFKWTLMASKMDGRSAEMIKNRYNYYLKFLEKNGGRKKLKRRELSPTSNSKDSSQSKEDTKIISSFTYEETFLEDELNKGIQNVQNMLTCINDIVNKLEINGKPSWDFSENDKVTDSTPML